MFDNEYISLSHLTRKLRLPKLYIQQQAKAGIIPHLNINGRMRFQEQTVRQALDKLAGQGVSNEQ